MLKKNSTDKVSFWNWLARLFDRRRSLGIRVLKVRFLAISVALVATGLICNEVQLFAVGQEMPVIRRIGYEGQRFVTVTDILERFRERNVGLSVEQAYDPARVERARDVIVDLLDERGRQNASVEVEVYDIPPRAVGVTFHIDEGAP